MKPRALTPSQLHEARTEYGTVEEFKVTLFKGDYTGTHMKNCNYCMHVVSGDWLRRDYVEFTTETIEGLISASPTGDINLVKPWIAEEGSMFRGVGYVAYDEDTGDYRYYNVEWAEL